MRTVRCSGRLGGGGVCPGGWVYAWAFFLRGVCVLSGCLPRGCLPGGMYTSPRGQTDACENITFPQQ